MKKSELVYREILYNAIENKKAVLTQAEISKKLGISLSIVNKAVNNISRIGATRINKRNFVVIDAKKHCIIGHHCEICKKILFSRKELNCL